MHTLPVNSKTVECYFTTVGALNYFKSADSQRRGARSGGSPGLGVMEGDSRSEGFGFESRHRILDGHFSHMFVVKMCKCLFEKTMNEKEAEVGPFF